jgi:hypothetical protein
MACNDWTPKPQPQGALMGVLPPNPLEELDAIITKLDAMTDKSINEHVLDGSAWERYADALIDARVAAEKAQEAYKEAKDG